MAESVLRLEIRGIVQGVGFRWAMVEQAGLLGVRGWVNRRDGSVEAAVAGSADAVEGIVGWARRGPRSAMVASVDIFASDGDFVGFEQRPTA